MFEQKNMKLVELGKWRLLKDVPRIITRFSGWAEGTKEVFASFGALLIRSAKTCKNFRALRSSFERCSTMKEPGTPLMLWVPPLNCLQSKRLRICVVFPQLLNPATRIARLIGRTLLPLAAKRSVRYIYRQREVRVAI